MGLAGLTAVFGMGTGVTPPVWSPEMYPAGGQARPGTGLPGVGHTSSHKPGKRMSGSCSTTVCQNSLTVLARRSVYGLFRLAFPFCLLPFYFCLLAFWMQADGSAPIGVVKLLGC